MCDQNDFRSGMSCVSSAVHLITTDGSAGMGGCTASAFSSITDSPPTLMICLNQRASVAGLVKENGCFNVNTLACEDQDLADIFAGQRGISGAERFNHGDWMIEEGRCPVLRSSLVTFECQVYQMQEMSTHFAIFGRITRVHLGAMRSGLVYQDRQYRKADTFLPLQAVA